MHTTTVGEKRDHEFEGEWIGIYGRVWREEVERSHAVIRL